jgi:hypothetical protein
MDPEAAVLRLHVGGHVPERILVLAKNFSSTADRDRVLVLPRSGGASDWDRAAPIPGYQRGQIGDLVIGDPGKHVGEPGLRIGVLELGRMNERQHDRRALATSIRPAEQPRLPAESNPAQLALGGIVGQADAAVLEEAREDVDALSMALATSLWRESLARSRFIHSIRSFTSGAISLRRAATRASGDKPLIERSSAKMASNFLTASNAIGEIVVCF